MTITYNLDIPHFGFKGIFSILFRWRGSLWKAISFPLFAWILAYYLVTTIYYFLLRPYDKYIFEKIVQILKDRTDSVLPITFILGFFVSSVLQQWHKCLDNIGWIDNSAISLSINMPGGDEERRMIRRTIIRYLVLSQTLVLRNVSIQVKRRFPNFDSIEAGNMMTSEERELLEKQRDDQYSQLFTPIIWAGRLVYDARQKEMISSDVIANSISSTIQQFQKELQNLLKNDWVPIPIAYPQLVASCVRFYFFICLFTRQIITAKEDNLQESFLFWIPLPTIVEFVIYMGWLQVAEQLLHPLGEEADNLECNYIIDKNLESGLKLVDCGGQEYPKAKRDVFWDSKSSIPLYNYVTADRDVYPMHGSTAETNVLKNVKEIVMTPHKSKLSDLDAQEEIKSVKKIDVRKFNNNCEMYRKKQSAGNANKKLKKLRKDANDNNIELISVKTPLLIESKHM